MSTPSSLYLELLSRKADKLLQHRSGISSSSGSDYDTTHAQTPIPTGKPKKSTKLKTESSTTRKKSASRKYDSSITSGTPKASSRGLKKSKDEKSHRDRSKSKKKSSGHKHTQEDLLPY